MQYIISSLIIGLSFLIQPASSFALSPDEICDKDFKGKDKDSDLLYKLHFQCSETQIIKKIYDSNTQELLETQTYEFGGQLMDPLQPADSFSIETNEESYSYNSLIQEKDVESDHSQSLHIAMMEEDLDISHPSVSPYIRRNSSEKLDEVDNDNDGFIDNLYGLSFLSMDNKPNTISHSIILAKDVSRPISHGTHVGSLITQGLQGISLMTYTFPKEESYFYKIGSYYDDVSANLKKNNIRIMNMSLGTNLSLEGPPPVVFKNTQLYNLQKEVSQKLISENPSTLFVVAAGNGTWGIGVNLDTFAYPTIPAAVDEPNVLVVGAINTAKLSASEMDSYKLTSFSNYGPKIVDILAPGFNVPGARLGSGSIDMSGTSMATPLVVNKVVVPLLQVNPKFNNEQLLKIILLTASIPDIKNPFPVKSGGIMNPQRALNVAKKITKSKSSILDAVIAELKTEGFTKEALNERLEFWKSRSLL